MTPTALRIIILVLLVGGLGPATLLACRGEAAHRLVGLELVGATLLAVMLLVVQLSGESYELIVPTALVVLSFAGTLVFTRLVHEPDEEREEPEEQGHGR